MVGMTMTQHDSLDARQVDVHYIQVVQRAVRRDARVEQDRVAPALVDDRNQKGCAMLSAQLFAGEEILLRWKAVRHCCRRHQGVEAVIHDGRDFDAIYGW